MNRDVMSYMLTKVVNSTSGHIGAKCRITYKEAKLGEDFGITELIALRVHAGNDACEIKKFRLIYEDGMERNIGVKAAVRTNDGVILYGLKSEFHFTRL